ncbi:bifunctional diaminohydroxyphosphoribosylaminopyrimidine deaminase/5-amino-6-(5-phosphoribosylamino)uracil reductase RibD [Compostibacter hankyongensis]|uniref:Riboflavin biosynthesis protein RibD n=1 Tax=Compostibacter hankyongensis TaxID=1007089 RepID=A0ABP8G4D0_9BACT
MKEDIITAEKMMRRCLQLAARGAGSVAPNPMVGAVLVYGERIIGEGWHARYGEAHAEVNCLESVTKEDRPLISASTLYVSLEPCAHHGKTPPCADRIIRERIPRVVIGCTDTFAEVAGKGIGKLRSAGVAVETGVLETECRYINRRFFTFHEQRRPYVMLKWARTPEGAVACADGAALKISGDSTDRLVHRWRSEEAAILVGSGTVLSDDPLLTTRYWSGSSPLRIVLDRRLRIPEKARLLQDGGPTWIFSGLKTGKRGAVEWIAADPDAFPETVLQELYRRKVQSVLVEGGPAVLQSFLDHGCWDEARVITGQVSLPGGIREPACSHWKLGEHALLHGDEINTYYPA